jgi:hypothetical protein
MTKATEIIGIHPRLLIMGEYGQGKTHLLGMLHDMYKRVGTKGMTLYDFDSGYPTLTANNFDVEVQVCVDKKPQQPSAWQHFSDDTERFVKDNQGYGILGIDSLTTLQQTVMNKVIQLNPLKDRRFTGSINLTTKNDFGVLVGIMMQFFPQLINLSEHMAVALTCHIRLESDTDSEGKTIGPPKWYPAITGRSLPTQIGLYFNEAIMCKTLGYGNAAKHLIQTSKDDKISLKSQIKGVPFELTFEEYVVRLAYSYKILDKNQLIELIRDYKLDMKVFEFMFGSLSVVK